LPLRFSLSRQPIFSTPQAEAHKKRHMAAMYATFSFHISADISMPGRRHA